MKKALFGISLLLFLNSCSYFDKKKDDKKAQDLTLNAIQDTILSNTATPEPAVTPKTKTKTKTKAKVEEEPQINIVDAPKTKVPPKTETVSTPTVAPSKTTVVPPKATAVPPKATVESATKTVIKTIPSSATTPKKPVEVTAKGPSLTPQSSALPVSFGNQMLSAVNALRKSGVTCGGEVMPPVKPLAWNPQLEKAAAVHVADMSANDHFSHAGTDGTLPDDRIKAAGYEWERVGENIGKGYKDVAAAVKGWKESTNHCKQMMSPDITEMGGARQDAYWCQTFAKPLE